VIGPQNWWQGENNGYTSWFAPLSGADIAESINAKITADMPEDLYDGSPYITKCSEPNGYSQSLCYWGGLNWYRP